jgi:hypothetical protein
MNIQLGISGSETTFNYAIVNYSYDVHGSTHTMADGSKRVQYSDSDKYRFDITITYVSDTVWEGILSELQNSKSNDLNLIIESDSYTVRYIPGTYTKTPILGTALGYDVSFSLQEC